MRTKISGSRLELYILGSTLPDDRLSGNSKWTVPILVVPITYLY